MIFLIAFFAALLLTSLLFSIKVLFDAIVGGTVALWLKMDGVWSPGDQETNSIYQAFYFLIIVLMFVFIDPFVVKKINITFGFEISYWAIIIGQIPLLAALVEDVWYYVFLNVFKVKYINTFFVWLLTNFKEWYVDPMTGIFPKCISGWIGWWRRFRGKKNICTPMTKVLAWNTIGYAVSMVTLLLLLYL